MRVAATRRGEVDGNLAGEPAGVAFDAGNLQQHMAGSFADRQAAKQARLAPMAGEFGRAASRTTQMAAFLFDAEDDFAFKVVGAGVTVAANTEV